MFFLLFITVKQVFAICIAFVLIKYFSIKFFSMSGRQFSLLFSHPDNKSAPLKFRKSTTTEITNGSIRNSSIAASKDMGYISTNSSEWGDSDPGLGEESSKAMVLKAETLQVCTVVQRFD